MQIAFFSVGNKQISSKRKPLLKTNEPKHYSSEVLTTLFIHTSALRNIRYINFLQLLKLPIYS